VVLSAFCILVCKRFSDIAKKYALDIECTDREAKFRKGIKEISDRRFYMNKISALWMRIGTWNRCPIQIISLIDSLACHRCGDS